MKQSRKPVWLTSVGSSDESPDMSKLKPKIRDAGRRLELFEISLNSNEFSEECSSVAEIFVI